MDCLRDVARSSGNYVECAQGLQIFIGALVRNLVGIAVSGWELGRRVVVGVWVRQHKEHGRKCWGMGGSGLGVSRRSRYFESHKGGQLHWGKLFGSKNESHPSFSPPSTVTHPHLVPLKARLPPTP